eukprot:Nitzschia sp. Nitz4//scaffold288_size23661//22263//23444//NITZ4_008473-RA/size23661-processed-gene-0.47-mRNA-1//-1//CDS//3329545809//887//frame0
MVVRSASLFRMSEQSSTSAHSMVSNASEGAAAINAANEDLLSYLQTLRTFPDFSLFSIDILASCEYMPQELQECYTRMCEVYPVDDDQVPNRIRETDLLECEINIDGWARWDMPGNEYYDMHQFPEGYTGYDGSLIWQFVHEKICSPEYNYNDNHWKADFNKAVSGLHAVVSAQVVRGIESKIDSGELSTEKGNWIDPEQEFERRLSPTGMNKYAIENMYYTYMLFLSAIAKVRDRFLVDCTSGPLDKAVEPTLTQFLDHPVFAESAIHGPSDKLLSHAKGASNTLWEARMKTRQLLRAMNCVQCNKCRLHGKVAMMGLATVLQIHLDNQETGTRVNRINRVGLASMIATMQKFARAVQLCQRMAS